MNAPIGFAKTGACEAIGCDNPQHCRGYCTTHYGRVKRGAPVNGPIQHKGLHATCTIDGCDEGHVARGYCHVHYKRWQEGRPIAEPVRHKQVPVGASLEERMIICTPVADPDVCWEWSGTRNRGYGIVRDGRRQRGAHVVAWERANGSCLLNGYVIRHKCDNPPCVNPAHLEIGTHADNAQDAVMRNRTAKGSANGMAKLHPAEVNGINLMLATGKYYQWEIGNAFNVSQTLVSHIKLGKAWGWL